MELKAYEALCIFSEMVRDENASDAVTRVCKEIEKQGGTIVQTVPLGRRTFARQLKKREAGHFARIDFELDPAKLVTLHGRFKLSEELFRVQVTGKERRSAKLVKAEAEAAAAAAEPKAVGSPDGAQ